MVDGLKRLFEEPYIRSVNVENFMDMKKEELSDNVKAKWIETKRLFIGISEDHMLDALDHNPHTLFIGKCFSITNVPILSWEVKTISNAEITF